MLEYPGLEHSCKLCDRSLLNGVANHMLRSTLARSTVQAYPPHACSPWWLFSGRGRCTYLLPSSFGVMLMAWHDGASHLVLQQVEEGDRVEQHMVPSGSKEVPVAVLYRASADFCVKDVACLGPTQQEPLDAPSDWLVTYALLEG